MGLIILTIIGVCVCVFAQLYANYEHKKLKREMKNFINEEINKINKKTN